MQNFGGTNEEYYGIFDIGSLPLHWPQAESTQNHSSDMYIEGAAIAGAVVSNDAEQVLGGCRIDRHNGKELIL